jgi:hypothetical protein
MDAGSKSAAWEVVAEPVPQCNDSTTRSRDDWIGVYASQVVNLDVMATRRSVIQSASTLHALVHKVYSFASKVSAPHRCRLPCYLFCLFSTFWNFDSCFDSAIRAVSQVERSETAFQSTIDSQLFGSS